MSKRRGPTLGDRLWSASRELAPTRVQRAMDVFSGRRDFKGAGVNRTTMDWIARLRAADEHVKKDATRLRARARELAMNNGFAKHYLRLLANNVIGPTGFAHQARVKNNDGKLAVAINDKIEEAWEEWGNAVTLDGRLSLVDLEKQALRGEGRDGESFTRLWRGGEYNSFGLALEPIDPDQIDHTMNREATKGSANEICMGIEKDSYGRRIRYWAWDGPYSAARQRNRIGIPADQIIHRYDVDRCNQTRGITWFHPVMLELHMLEAYFDSELVASRQSADNVVLLTRKEGTGMPTPEPKDDEKSELIENMMQSQPGSWAFAPDGYGAEVIAPEHPVAAFGDFMKSGLRWIGSGWGLTYPTLAGDLESVNFSSHKSGKNDERVMWRSFQYEEVVHRLRRFKAELIPMAILRGIQTDGREGLVLDNRDPKKFLAGRFKGCGWPSPDPLKDANAFVIEVEHGVNTCSWYLEERGRDFEEFLELRKEELALAKAAGVDISNAMVAAAGIEAQKNADAADAEDAKDTATKKNGNRIAALAGRN